MQRCMFREPKRRPLHVVTVAPNANAKAASAVNSVVPVILVARVHVTRAAACQVRVVSAEVVVRSERR